MPLKLFVHYVLSQRHQFFYLHGLSWVKLLLSSFKMMVSSLRLRVSSRRVRVEHCNPQQSGCKKLPYVSMKSHANLLFPTLSPGGCHTCSSRNATSLFLDVLNTRVVNATVFLTSQTHQRHPLASPSFHATKDHAQPAYAGNVLPRTGLIYTG